MSSNLTTILNLSIGIISDSAPLPTVSWVGPCSKCLYVKYRSYTDMAKISLHLEQLTTSALEGLELRAEVYTELE